MPQAAFGRKATCATPLPLSATGLAAFGNWTTRVTFPAPHAFVAKLQQPLASFDMPNAWLAELELLALTSVATGVLPEST